MRAGRWWIGPGLPDLAADAANRPFDAPDKMRDPAAAWLTAQRRPVRGRHPALREWRRRAFPERTLDRAKAQLHIGSRKAYFKKNATAWNWFDWSAEWPKDAPFPKPTPGELPDLTEMIVSSRHFGAVRSSQCET